MLSRNNSPACGLGLLGALLILFGSSALAGQEIQRDYVLHILNPAKPPEGVVRWELDELWRIDADSDLLIGLPTRVAVDAERRIHVLDAQLNHVQVFSLSGEHLATLSREGDGPGEMRNPSDMLVEPNGNVGIVQEYPGKVVRFDRRGDPLPSIFPGGPPEEGGWCVLMTGCARAHQLVVCGRIDRRDEEGETVRRLFMSSFAGDGTERANYIEKASPRRAGGQAMAEHELLQPFLMSWDIGPDGRVFVVPEWDHYLIHVFKPEGGFDRVIEREYEPWKRTEQEKQHILGMLGVPPDAPPPLELDEYAPTVAGYQGGVQVHENGELWIHPSRGNRNLPAGILARYDVFDREGHFRRQVEIACPGDPWNDRLVFVGEDYVVRIRRFVDAFVTSLGPGGLPEDAASDDATPAVICYRIKR